MTQSVASQVLSELNQLGRGHVFTPGEFLHLGSRASVDKALSRLAREGRIQRLAQGLYVYPETNPLVGEVPPAPQAIAEALVRSRGVTAQVSEAAAANALGVSTQVPARIVYLTNGSPTTYRIGNTEIRFKRAGPRRLAGAGTLAGTVLQALRYLGPEGISPSVIERLRNQLHARESQRLNELVPMTPAWMHPAVRQLTTERTGG